MRISRRQMRRNEQLVASLEAGETDPKMFFDEYTPFPMMADFGFFQTPLFAAHEIVRQAALYPNQRILDFGAGLGVFSYVLLETGALAEEITAVELAMEVHDIGIKLVPSVNWVWDNACHSSFWKPRMGQFDLVIGNPPWGKTRERETWGPDDTNFGDFILAGDGNSRRPAKAEAMALESALRVLRPGGEVVFLLPSTAFESRGWAKYERSIGPYEDDREFYPFDVDFVQTKVKAGLAKIIRNDTPFPGQVFVGGDKALSPAVQATPIVQTVPATQTDVIRVEKDDEEVPLVMRQLGFGGGGSLWK